LVRWTGQLAGTENRKPAKATGRHDDGTAGAPPEARATARGEQVRVSSTRRAIGPDPETKTPRDGTKYLMNGLALLGGTK
jgi:hypothetical protein